MKTFLRNVRDIAFSPRYGVNPRIDEGIWDKEYTKLRAPNIYNLRAEGASRIPPRSGAGGGRKLARQL